MKRLSTSDPLTPDDVADRLNRALDRVLRIMWDIQQTEGSLMDEVKRSRYLIGGLPNYVAYELQQWGYEPFPVKGDTRYG